MKVCLYNISEQTLSAFIQWKILKYMFFFLSIIPAPVFLESERNVSLTNQTIDLVLIDVFKKCCFLSLYIAI